tara:strand:- start:17 stop:241 length:225 start_codon:yes stop_codon:yes gene_type:complete
MIRHTVVFKLKHATGSDAELDFLRSAQKLGTAISVEQNFETVRQAVGHGQGPDRCQQIALQQQALQKRLKNLTQ